MWPTPHAGLLNDGEDPESWRARQAALAARGINGNGAGVPLTIAAKEFTNEDSAAWPTPRSVRGPTYRQHAADGRQGLSLDGRAERWPTPRDQDSYERRNRKTIEAVNRGEADLTLPSKVAMWATPRADEREQRNGYTRPNSHVALSRQTRLWPTPQTDSFRSRGGDRVEEEGLDRMARRWPTPQASEDRHAGPSEDRRRGDTVTKAAEAWRTPRAIYGEHRGMADPEHLTGQAIEMWHTPDATPLKTDFSARPGVRGQATLSKDATMWGTPIGRDWKDSGMDPDAATPTNGILGRQVLRTALPGLGSSPSTPNSPRPRLNPRFVEWLMGLPPGWCDPSEPTSSGLSATRSYLSRLRSLLDSFTGG